MWSNFHTHSNYCDGKGEVKEYVEEARDLKLISLGFSSHAPLPFPCTWCMRLTDFDHYLNNIGSLKESNPEIEIYKGLEIDFIPDVISPNTYKGQLDYTVGSVHFVDKLPDGRPWEIDGLHSHFLEGLETIFGGDIRAAIQRYYALTREMIEQSPPSIVGHIDKIKIQNKESPLFGEDEPWYRLEIQKTLAQIADSDCIVEVNTRGIYQKKSLTTYPSPWILELLRDMSIPVTLSSDTHLPKDMINQFPETAKLLSDIGFKSISVLHEGLWRPFSFNAHGIIR